MPNSPDEEVSVNALYSHPKFGTPDLVVATADASQLSRHLLLTKQLIGSGFRVIIALTMVDMLKKKGFNISVKELGEELGCDVVAIDGRTGKGINELISVVNKNLTESSISGKKNPTIFKALEKNELVEAYKKIGRIVNKVIN